MAEGQDEATSNWWGSWISSAKSKSSSVLEAVKKDLDELSTAVRTEVSNAGSAIGDSFKTDDPTIGNVKKSISSFFGQVTEALIPSLDDDDYAEAVLITADGQVTLTGFHKHLAEMQAVSATYLQPPETFLAENYHRWMEVVEQDQFTQNRLAKHLASSEILNEKYLTLVPDQVSHMEFWQRYLFKRALLEDALANAELAERKAKAELNSTKTVSPMKGTAKAIILTEQPKKIIADESDTVEDDDTDDLTAEAEAVAELTTAFGASHLLKDEDGKWETEDFASVEISEEEQARLLQEYEEEIQEREMKKSLIVPIEEKIKQDKLLAQQQQQQKSQKSTTNKQSVVTAQKQQPKSKNAGGVAKPISNPPTTATKKPIATKAQPDKTSPTNKTTKTSEEISPKAKSTTTSSIKDDKDDKDEFASDESWEKDFDLADSAK